MGSRQSTQPLPRYPVFERVPYKDNSLLIIFMISLVVIAAIVVIIVYAIKRPGETSTTGRCEPGLCVANKGTGLKTCPSSDTEQLTYNLVFDVCTSRSYCQDDELQCAVLGGGILNCDGVCGPGNPECRCVAAIT